MYSLIRPTAYEPNPAAGPWRERYQTIEFSQRWRETLTDLNTFRRGPRTREFDLPTRGLGALLRTHTPGVMAVGRGSGADDSPWIYARESVPDGIVGAVTTAWAMGLRPALRQDAEYEERLASAIESIRADRLEWTPATVDLTSVRCTPAGTADPDRRLYHLVPEILAARLAARRYSIPGINRDLRFRVVDREQCAELVSWPPDVYRAGGEDWHYSAVITITVQTVPFVENYRVHVSTGIRRWNTSPPIDLSRGRTAHALLDVRPPWLTDATITVPRLMGNRIGWNRASRHVDWCDRGGAELLPHLDITGAFPPADEIVSAPGTWIRGRHDMAAGVVYQTAHGPHRVGPGLFSGERACLDAWVEEGLSPLFVRAPELRRVRETTKPNLLRRPPASHPDERADSDRQRASTRRAALRAALDGKPLDVDIVWQFPETRDALLDSLAKLLDLSADTASDPSCREWRHPDLLVRVKTRELGALGGPLDPRKRPGLPQPAALGEAIRARRVAVGAEFPPARGVSLAVVEIGGERRFHTPDSDPKFALRLGFADTGRLSKFILAPTDAATDPETRATWTWLDAFRQLGAAPIPTRRVGPEIPEDLQYVALWVVRRTAAGPTGRAGRRLIALRIRPGDARHPVRGWDDTRKSWVPYPEFLIELARGVETTGEPVPDDGDSGFRSDVERRIRSILYQVRDRPTLLLANAGNLRSSWHWLRNGSIAVDQLGFDGGVQRLSVYGSDLRFVLTRDRNGREEVPQWYAPASDGEVAGLASGIWTEGDAIVGGRVFASITDKPHTAGKLPKAVMKLGPHPQWPQGPSKRAWNPQYLELTVLGCLSKQALADAGRDDVKPDHPATWAALTHQLRLHDDYAPLVNPLPLHLAKLTEAYVLPVEPDEATE